MQLLNPFENPNPFETHFFWPEQGKTGVEFYYTNPSIQIPQLFGILEYRGWVVKEPVRLEWESFEKPREPKKKGVLQLSQVKLALHYSSKIYIAIISKEVRANVLILSGMTIGFIREGALMDAEGDLRTGEGTKMEQLGISIDRGSFLQVIR